MGHIWNDNKPIYRQLMSEIVGWILSGDIDDGDPLPSIRKIASQFQVNPLTVSKACQELSNNQIVDSQRGIGLFVSKGARKMLMRSEKEKFLQEELPDIVRRMRQLGLTRNDFLTALEKEIN